MLKVKKIFCSLLLASSLMFPAAGYADTPVFQTGLGFEFASGKYGTDTRTDSIYAPVTMAIFPTERLGFSLEIPFLYQSSSAVNTTVFGAGGQMMHGQKRAVNANPGMMGGGSISSAAPGEMHASQYGLGDIIARAGYVLVPEGTLMPRVRPYLQVKFPTADKNAALGTGAFDEGGVVEFSKVIGDWYSFAEVGYTFQGKSTRLATRNYLGYNAGAGYAIAERFLPMVIVKGSTAPVAGSSNLLEMRLKLKYLITAQTGVEGYIAKGLTTNSPDYGSGFAVYHEF